MEHTMCFNEDFSWDYEMKEFYDGVVKGKDISLGTIDDAVNLMRMLENIYK